jgi:PAS domain-containing protein
MRTVTELDRDSITLARDATLISVGLAVVGSGLGVFAIMQRAVTGVETAIVLSSGVFGVAAFATLYFCKATVKTLAALSTAYYALYLCSGSMAAVLGNGKHVNLFTYLVWFFPLLVFNKLVNSGMVGRFLGRFVLAAPLALLAALAPRMIAVFPIELLIVVVGYGLSYVCFALALNAATRYREAYIVERERAESLRIESAVLESISDCFISVDPEYRLVYINDAATGEFGIDRQWALTREISAEISGFFSASVLAGLRAAARGGVATSFEAQIEDQERWYLIRCFPRPERMSIFFAEYHGGGAVAAQPGSSSDEDPPAGFLRFSDQPSEPGAVAGAAGRSDAALAAAGHGLRVDADRSGRLQDFERYGGPRCWGHSAAGGGAPDSGLRAQVRYGRSIWRGRICSDAGGPERRCGHGGSRGAVHRGEDTAGLSGANPPGPLRL